MPNIVQYDSTAEITPSDRGIQAAEVAGRRLGMYGHELAQQVNEIGDKIEQHMAVMETSQLYKTNSDFVINAINGYDEATKDPANRSNPHFGDQFMASITPTLDQWVSSAKTDRGKLLASTLAAEARQTIFRHVAAGQAAQDVTQYQENKTGYLNNLSAQLVDDPSPKSFANAQALWHQWVIDNTAHISNPEDRERLMREDEETGNTQLTLARYKSTALAITKQIGATGDDSKAPAKAQGEDDVAKKVGFEFLDPTQQAAVSGWIQEATPEGHRQYDSMQASQKQAQLKDVDQALSDVEKNMYIDNGHGGVTVNPSPTLLERLNQIQEMPGGFYRNQEIESLRTTLHTTTQDVLSGKERVSDQGVYNSLSGRVGSTTNPLTKAEVDQNFKNLSDSDYHFLREAASDSKTANPKINQALTELHRWQEQIKPAIDKSNLMSGVDQSGAVNFSHFSWDTEHKLRQAIDAGEDPQHAVQRLTDPRSPNGFYRFIPQYQRTMSQSMDVIQQMANPNAVQPIPAPPGGVGHEQVAPRKPGESSEDYLKRTSH